MIFRFANRIFHRYVKFIKPKQGVKVSADPDDYDFEDEEYLTEDVADFEAEVK